MKSMNRRKILRKDAITAALSALPVIDGRLPKEILGYDDVGTAR
jgi:hypothetical protein